MPGLSDWLRNNNVHLEPNAPAGSEGCGSGCLGCLGTAVILFLVSLTGFPVIEALAAVVWGIMVVIGTLLYLLWPILLGILLIVGIPFLILALIVAAVSKG